MAELHAAALREIAAHFAKGQPVSAVDPLGNGNINSTYLVTTGVTTGTEKVVDPATQADATRFVLQRINTQVFQQPELVIQNMSVLSEHVRSQEADLPHRWETPRILSTTQGQDFWVSATGDYWRAISFIEDSQVFDTVESADHAREVGIGLGTFHRLISTLPAERLADTLEGFHITPTYLAKYNQALAQRSAAVESPAETLSPAETEQVNYCLQFVADRQEWAHVLENAKASGHLQLRPIHGDPKVNNIMLGSDQRAVSLIDLDTLKPGLVHYDIGDCLRSSCNPLGEETLDWQAVSFDTDLAQAMLEGYLSQASDFLTEQDYDYLYDGIRLIAFELGLRFFTDYLAGNVYFKVSDPAHNLRRALVQFKLTESIEAQADTLQAIIDGLRA